MSKKTNYNIQVLLEALNKVVSTTSIFIEQGIDNRLKEYTKYYIRVAMKSYSDFLSLNKTYNTKKEALQAFNSIYGTTYINTVENHDELQKFSNPKIFNTENEDEGFLILAIYNLPTFFCGKNLNNTKHLLNTYIPKVRKCLKSFDEYLVYFDKTNTSTLTIKTLLFKFLIENS